MLCLGIAKVVCLTVAKVIVCRHDAEYQHLLPADILIDTDSQAQRLPGASGAVARLPAHVTSVKYNVTIKKTTSKTTKMFSFY